MHWKTFHKKLRELTKSEPTITSYNKRRFGPPINEVEYITVTHASGEIIRLTFIGCISRVFYGPGERYNEPFLEYKASHREYIDEYLTCIYDMLRKKKERTDDEKHIMWMLRDYDRTTL